MDQSPDSTTQVYRRKKFIIDDEGTLIDYFSQGFN